MGFDKKDILHLLLGEQSTTNSRQDLSEQQSNKIEQRPKSHQDAISQR
jgi:hypothetical protein